MNLKYKLYRMAWNKAKNRVPKYPVHVDFEVSSVCNLKCGFCPQSEDNPSFERGFMDLVLFKRIVDEIAGKVKSIKLNLRGEPTLHPDFDEFLRYADGKFIDIRVNTNGQYTNKAYAHWFTKFCHNINFSVDAFYTDTYAKVRGGDFDLLLNNIQDVINFIKKRKKKPILTLSYVVTEDNKDELKYFKKFWKARYPKVKFLVRPAMERVVTPCHAPDEHIHLKKVLMLGNKEEVGRKNCYMANRRLVVTSTGKVSYCCLLWHNADYIGDATKDNILDMWKINRMEVIRTGLKNIAIDTSKLPKMCQNCESSESYVWK